MNLLWLYGMLGFVLIVAIIVAVYPLKLQSRVLQWSTAISLIVGSMLGYWQWGAWKALQEYTHQQVVKEQVRSAMKSLKSTQELIDRLKQHLQKNPGSAQGWFILGRIYASQNQWTDALSAFHKAHQLAPENEKYTINYAQCLWQKNHQKFTPALRQLFQTLLTNNPKQPDALSMLAMDAFQSHDYQKSISYWTQLLVLVPKDSIESKTIRQAIAKAQSLK